MIQLQNMATDRCKFGLTFIGNLIFVIGGITGTTWSPVDKTECLDVISQQWSELSKLPDNLTDSINAVSEKARYILAFGGSDGKYNNPLIFERFFRFDTIKFGKGW